MSLRLLIVFLLACFYGSAQTADSLVIPAGSMLNRLSSGDSITYYQCHVEEAIQQLSTASGQTLVGQPQKYSITEKYVVKKRGSAYYADYYTSSLTVFPNRKFSGLKIREKPYWEFKKERQFNLDERAMKMLIALEKQGREAMEYDYPITKYTTNQLIIRQRKNFKQLVIDGNYVLSKLIAK
jgi:hypothetical protein